MQPARGFNALDLQRAQQDRVLKRLDQDADVKARWVAALVDLELAQKRADEVEEAVRAVFKDATGDALKVLRDAAVAQVANRPHEIPVIPNPNANRIQGNEIEARQASR